MRHYDLVILAHQANSIRHYRAYAALIGLLHGTMPFAWRDPLPRPVGGHYAVTRSLVAGLERIGARFAYRPRLENTVARAAIVLAGVKELQAAIEWRKNGGCKVLLAGPNIVDTPFDQGGILLSPFIDLVVVASAKVQRSFSSTAPDLARRICVWPAGVDENYWRPSESPVKKSVLIYNKKMSDISQKIVESLSMQGFTVGVINYSDKRGSKYAPHEYRAALNSSIACVMLTNGETQGIAAVEAWSMNVPTLVYRPVTSTGADVLPYLAPETGSYWSTPQGLFDLLLQSSLNKFSPRDWVLANMTDPICASQLLLQIRSHSEDFQMAISEVQ
jgi:hypothetical protein